MRLRFLSFAFGRPAIAPPAQFLRAAALASLASLLALTGCGQFFPPLSSGGGGGGTGDYLPWS